jgi:hypothetical protein
MGQSLDQILTQVGDGDTVHVAMVSNQDNGIVSYAIGGLVFHQSTGGIILNGPPFRPARLASNGASFAMYFSDRMLQIDPPPSPGSFGVSARQPFNANATENLSVTITLGAVHVMSLGVFDSRSAVILTPMGDVLVGAGPSMGHSAASVFVVAFLGISRPPH